MKKRIFSISVFFILMSGVVYSQALETGIFAGASYYLGDINPGTHFDQGLFSTGALLRYSKGDRWAYRFNLLFGQVQASDQLRKAVDNRNLAFSSKITEISGVVEFHFLPYEMGSKDHRYTPYIFGGIGMFFFNPKYGQYNLRDYGTEGQKIGYMGRTPYALQSLTIPFGIGFKYSLTERISIAAEWGMRKTFTDYLDDVSTTYYQDAEAYYLYWQSNPGTPLDMNVYLSDPTLSHDAGMQRGNSSTNDWYSFYGITLTYKFDIGGPGCVMY